MTRLIVVLALLVGVIFLGRSEWRQRHRPPPPAVEEITLTFIEGWNLRDIGHALEEAGLAPSEDLFAVTGVPAKQNRRVHEERERLEDDFPFLKEIPVGVSLEGYLFPDTYRLYTHATAADVVRKMLQNFDDKFTPALRAEAARRERSIFEIITMASIVEREARTREDRRLVADVLWRRAAVGMPLQVDASVNYVTGKNVPSISLDDKKVDSLYNTYKYAGLPRGPIANPSLEAIEAAIYPQVNNSWYFLSTPHGEMKYAKTLREHETQKEQYLR